jgi:membrane protease YdiL (CAAX protease family)
MLPALGLAAVIVAVEHLARHFVLFWLPALGSRRVNDMLAMGVFYVGLVWLTIPSDQRSLVAIGRAVGGILACARRWQVWVAAFAALIGTILLGFVDRFLWGSVQLPSAISPWRWENTLLEAAAPLLVPASLLLVNGVVVPFAEEWLWRGLIQPRVIGAVGSALGILITAVCSRSNTPSSTHRWEGCWRLLGLA